MIHTAAVDSDGAKNLLSLCFFPPNKKLEDRMLQQHHFFFPLAVHPEEPCNWVVSCQLRNAQEMVDFCILFWLGEMETLFLPSSHIRIFFYRQLLRWIMDESKCPWKLSFRRQKLNRRQKDRQSSTMGSALSAIIAINLRFLSLQLQVFHYFF